MFKKLLDLDEVCFQGAVVEEERRVSPRGQVLELGWLPGDDRTMRRKQRRGFRTSTRLLSLSESSLWINNIILTHIILTHTVEVTRLWEWSSV